MVIDKAQPYHLNKKEVKKMNAKNLSEEKFQEVVGVFLVRALPIVENSVPAGLIDENAFEHMTNVEENCSYEFQVIGEKPKVEENIVAIPFEDTSESVVDIVGNFACKCGQYANISRLRMHQTLEELLEYLAS